MNFATLRVLVGDSMFALAPGNFFWPYFAGIAILVIGLFVSRKDLAQARGHEKLLILGPVFFAAPMAVFASQHFTETKFVSQVVPRWMPGHIFWTYFVGTCVIAAAVSIAAKKQARLAAILLGAMLILFVLLLHIPNIIARPRNIFMWAPGFRDLAFSGGALAFAGTQTEKWREEGRSWLIGVARIFVSAPTIFFGVVHLLHPEFVPADDFDRLTPTWIPGHALWAYAASVLFIVLGASMLLNRRTRLAATYLGIMALLLLLFVFLPMLVSKPRDVDGGLDFFVSTLAFGGVAFLLAGAIPGGEQTG